MADLRDEMSTARTQADRDRIIEKYSYLFDDNRPVSKLFNLLRRWQYACRGGKRLI